VLNDEEPPGPEKENLLTLFQTYFINYYNVDINSYKENLKLKKKSKKNPKLAKANQII
jgi:hypothetical protein